MEHPARNPADDEDVDGGMSTDESDIIGLGPFLLTLCLFLASVGLILWTSALTKAPPPDMGYYTHPAFFPTIALVVVAIGSGLVTIRCLIRSWPLDVSAFLVSLWRHGHLPALFSLLYVCYFYAVALIGYIPATICFVAVTLAFSKVTLKQWATGVVTLPALCYVVFVYFFEIWFPSPSLF